MAGFTLEIFELWQTAPGAGRVAEASEVSFSRDVASRDTAHKAPVWRLDVGGETGGVRRLSRLEAEVRRARGRLESVPDRLDTFLRRGISRPDGEISFALGAAADPTLAPAERELSAMAAQARGEVGFAAPTVDLGWVLEEAKAALRRSVRVLAHAAWVETTWAGRLVGRTSVGWSGRTRTVLLASGDVQENAMRGALHQRNVALALASRRALLSTLVLVQEGAIKLSLLLGASGGFGAVVAVPMTWRYIQKILEQLPSGGKSDPDDSPPTRS